MVVEGNDKQAKKVIEQYVKRNTVKSGPLKGTPPTLGDLMIFTEELVFAVSLMIDVTLNKNNRNVTIEEVMNEIIYSAYRFYFTRREELEAKGITIENVGAGANKVRKEGEKNGEDTKSD